MKYEWKLQNEKKKKKRCFPFIKKKQGVDRSTTHTDVWLLSLASHPVEFTTSTQ